jgi:hypothetical protein
MLATPAPVERLPTTRTLKGTLLEGVDGVELPAQAIKSTALTANAPHRRIPNFTASLLLSGARVSPFGHEYEIAGY